MEVSFFDFKAASLSEIEVLLAGLRPPYPDKILEALKRDSRAGARKLYEGLISKQQQAERVRARLEKMFFYEKEARAEGFRVIAGVDEAGRGPIAGPVVAAAVILPPETGFAEINDSKLLSNSQRRKALPIIAASALIGVGVASSEEIDRINIHKASSFAMRLAIQDLNAIPDLALVDGLPVVDLGVPQRAIVGGDKLSMSVAAASIVAKVIRDEMMLEFDKRYPVYKFAEHKGYATSEHLRLIRRFGVSPIHRRSFAPVMECIERPFL